MAGSYKHVVDSEGKFRGVDHLDNLGDAYEAIEEMYGMIWYLAHDLAGYAGDAYRAAETADLVEEARRAYRLGIARSPGVNVRGE